MRSAAALLLLQGALGSKRIVCIGDSLTFGYRGWFGGRSPRAYPTMLQEILGDSYEVLNLGNSGKTMQKNGHDSGMTDASYWNTSEFQTLTNITFDIAVIMLGSNDAKDESQGGPPNWPHASCDSGATLESCPYLKDYAAMIDVVRQRGPPLQGAPEIFLGVPPPITKQGAYHVNRDVVNSILPRLVRMIAAAKGIDTDHVIDFHSAMGGLSWRGIPAAGCKGQNVSGCAYMCDNEWCDDCHPADAGFMAMGAQVGAAVLSGARSLQLTVPIYA